MDSTLQPLLGDRGTGIIRRRPFSQPEDEPLIARCRRSARDFLTSKWGHYLVLLLIAIDVCCGFSEFLIQLHVCESKEKNHRVDGGWEVTEEALGITGLVISCLFVLELTVAVLSFGFGYFSNWFHIFDSLVIVVAFVIEVALQGLVEELGSLVVVLRLWRVFMIIEELRSASEDTMEEYTDEIERLRLENASLKQRLGLDVGGDESAP
ncbi:voltage-gated hydrogen channel 1 [Penicillium verhagenii]|uniref:voltage-gated hydrogen channel 1 n=1 Tax=Penicillium verhagenii TaxID=1562060 RepID=UPI0025452507|nr:voltage-gated hydrogen channel 1 [Penicillium verhagenii]KAJ5921336.1 voltage-gated hydrogen channel 1 [Penicillium verhagenii]